MSRIPAEVRIPQDILPRIEYVTNFIDASPSVLHIALESILLNSPIFSTST
jgi:hypothetical protein